MGGGRSGRYLKQAKFHAERINYYHRHAGSMGYDQAEYDRNMLAEMLVRALRSKNERHVAPVIQQMMKSAQKKMDEMEKRKK